MGNSFLQSRQEHGGEQCHGKSGEELWVGKDILTRKPCRLRNPSQNLNTPWIKIYYINGRRGKRVPWQKEKD